MVIRAVDKLYFNYQKTEKPNCDKLLNVTNIIIDLECKNTVK